MVLVFGFYCLGCMFCVRAKNFSLCHKGLSQMFFVFVVCGYIVSPEQPIILNWCWLVREITKKKSSY